MRYTMMVQGSCTLLVQGQIPSPLILHGVDVCQHWGASVLLYTLGLKDRFSQYTHVCIMDIPKGFPLKASLAGLC